MTISKHKNNELELDIKSLVDYLATQPDVLAAYLFGSYATGKARPQSDVDVAVLLSEADDLERFERRLRLIGEIVDYLQPPAGAGQPEGE